MARPSETGSRASTEPQEGLGPLGFDPARETIAFIKNDLADAPGKIGVAIVQKDNGSDTGECVGFRLCDNREEANAYMRLHGIDPANVVYRRPAIATEAQRATTGTGVVHEGADPKGIAQNTPPKASQ